MDDEQKAEIRYRAYELWEQAGRPPGQHLTYWTAAEREYLARVAEKADHAEPRIDADEGYDSGMPDRFGDVPTKGR